MSCLPQRLHEPQYAGSALWAHSLAVLVKSSFDCLVHIQYVLSEREFEESKEACVGTYVFLLFLWCDGVFLFVRWKPIVFQHLPHQQFHYLILTFSHFYIFLSAALTSVIQDFKNARYQFWLEDLNNKAKDNGLQLRLEKPLLRRLADGEGSTVGGGNNKTGSEIVCNFDEDLLCLFSEVSYWEKFQNEYSIPYMAHDLCNKKEQLRIMRENVMLVVRAYNDIIRDANAEERRLFLDHIRKLDRRISQGMTKLTWQNRAMIEIYVKDCCSNCHEVHSTSRR